MKAGLLSQPPGLLPPGALSPTQFFDLNTMLMGLNEPISPESANQSPIPVFDLNTMQTVNPGQVIDPNTGKPIDPKTGNPKDGSASTPGPNMAPWLPPGVTVGELQLPWMPPPNIPRWTPPSSGIPWQF